MASGGTKITLTTSYQTAFEASAPFGSGSDGKGAFSFLACAALSTGIVIKVTVVDARGQADATHEIPWVDSQVYGYSCSDRYRRIGKIEVKGETAAGSCYVALAKHA